MKRKRVHIPLWWLSFNNDGEAKGVCIVRGRDIEEAIRICWRLKINPGGEVMSVQCPPEFEKLVPFEAIGKLLPLEEVQRLIPSAGAVKRKI